ncbi:MAG: hypothetical protein CR966_00480 [Pseudomonadales bacterium]|nr:MAG: hypothetical protein CR966_00480 [Pseudomonadales bacterium]
MNNESNIKHVMRTALVGIKPAKQVMLKGYLRVLLRLEADLEWVSASHPHVDLFMINEEFRRSPNVIKLLQSQPSKPVLYVSKDEAHDGGRVVGDSLVLPLKELNQLSEWLFKKVEVLQQKSKNHERRESADKSIDNKSSHNDSSSDSQSVNNPSINNQSINNQSVNKKDIQQTNTDKSPATNNGHQSVVDTESSNVGSSHSNTHNNTHNNSDVPLVEIIKSLQKGVDGTYELKIKDTIIAIVEPSRARVWTDINSERTIRNNSLSDWRMQKTSVISLSDENAINLKQWLWNVSRHKVSELTPLVDDKQTYQLQYWVKPKNPDNRRNLLSIMTAIESVAISIGKISEVANTDEEESKSVIAGLLFAGCLQPNNYHNINISSTTATTNTSANVSSASSAVDNSPAIDSRSPFDSVLSKRAAGIAPDNKATSSIPAGVISSAKSSQSTAQPKKEEKSEKLGFLGRLRRKLGL